VVIQILPTFSSHGSLSALLAPATPLPFFAEFVKRAKDFSCDIANYHQGSLSTPLLGREAYRLRGDLQSHHAAMVINQFGDDRPS
jgi:hypothetical protein